jgi:Protein of unknown function (DUF4245)
VSDKPRRVVAELGRPETPQEAADRRATTSREHREHQTFSNLVYALLVCVAIVVVIVLAVPQGDYSGRSSVDWHQNKAEAAAGLGVDAADPVLSKAWTANVAELRDTDDVPTWYIGFETPDEQFAAVAQGVGATDAWTADELDNRRKTGTLKLDGRTWDVFDHRDLGDAAGNVEYALRTTIGTSTVLVYGTARIREITQLAQAVSTSLGDNG